MQHSCSHHNAYFAAPRTHPCSHNNAICTHPLQNTEEEPTLKRSKPHPSHTKGTHHRRLQPLYTEKRTVSCSGFLPKTSPMQYSCSHYNAICIHPLQNTEKESIDLEMIQTAPAAHRRCPSSPAAATLRRKTYGFVLRFLPPNQPHATFMQPSQCVSQANPHVSTHMATEHDNNHAAIARMYCSAPPSATDKCVLLGCLVHFFGKRADSENNLIFEHIFKR